MILMQIMFLEHCHGSLFAVSFAFSLWMSVCSIEHTLIQWNFLDAEKDPQTSVSSFTHVGVCPRKHFQSTVSIFFL